MLNRWTVCKNTFTKLTVRFRANRKDCVRSRPRTFCGTGADVRPFAVLGETNERTAASLRRFSIIDRRRDSDS